MGLKYTAFTAAFKALDSVGADRWLRSLARGCGVILMLHHVRPQGRRKFAPNQALEITPEFLDIALTELRREGFEIIPLDKLPERLRLPKPTSRPFAILTFDDGYRDNVEYAWPILRRHKAPWTLFVTTDFLNGKGQLWWLELEEAIARLDSVVFTANEESVVLSSRTAIEKQLAFKFIYQKLRAGPSDQLQRATAALAAQAGVDTRKLVLNLCLGWEEVQLMAREPDVSIGAHSISHPILAKCDLTTVMREIAENKMVLEGRLGKPVRHLAYPFGDLTAVGVREFQLARQAGYVTAITSQPGHIFYEHATHLHALPRVSINGSFQNRTALRGLLSGVPFWIWNRRRVMGIRA